MGTREELVNLLADGAIHSGADLALDLGCTRAAVWKQLQGLRSMGLAIESSPGRGYQLERPLELLEADPISKAIRSDVGLESLDVCGVVESTSERLRGLPAPAPGKLRAALAEYQTGGRGRRGRAWLSPFGSGLCLSVSWCFSTVPPTLSALALAAGVAVNRAVGSFGPGDLGLKWPNDIIAGGGKLGGLLVDVQGESDGPITMIIGVGINIHVSEQLCKEVGREEVEREDAMPPVGLSDQACAVPVSRNLLAARLINEFADMLDEFGRSGFVRFIDAWRDYDVLNGKHVRVSTGPRVRTGIAVGIGDDGALHIESGGKVEQIVSGDVTVRRLR